MGNKKKTYNGFYFFMTHVKEDFNSKGIAMSLRDASDIAGKKWEKMTSEEKKPFEEKAKRAKAESKNKDEKFTSQGVSFTVLDREQAEKQHKILKMKNDILNTISVAQLTNSLATTDFFLIDINIFCECAGFFVPAEIAVSRFNLKNGVYDEYHSLIQPGSVPIGYASAARETSESTHQLPVPPDALGESSMIDILTNFSKFLLEDRDALPPLYTLAENMEKVSGVLKQICHEEDVALEFEVNNLTDLFFYLRNACANENSESSCLCELALLRDTYDYFSGLACEYHETTDVINNCSLSRVKRWGYNLADYCASYLNIKLIPGKHLPYQADIKNEHISAATTEESFDSVQPSGTSMKTTNSKKNYHSEDIDDLSSKVADVQLKKSQPWSNDDDTWTQVSTTSTKSKLSQSGSEFKTYAGKCEPVRQPKTTSKVATVKQLVPRGRGRSFQNS